MLPSLYRLKRKSEFQKVLQEGSRLQFPLFGLFYAPSTNGQTKIGVVVSKAISKRAHERNRARRLIHEALQSLHTYFPEETWLVFLAKRRLIDAHYTEVQEQVAKALSLITTAARE